MGKLFSIIMILALVITMILMGCAGAKSPTSGPIVLKGLVPFDPERPQVAHIQWYADRINERAKGELTLDMIGGPEIIGMFDQPEALKDGDTIQYLSIFTAAYKSSVPEGIVMSVSEYTAQEEREPGGYYDILLEAHARPEMNAHYLGRAFFGGFYFYTNKRIEKLEDFRGLKVGVTVLWEPITKALGATPVLIEEPDIYTAMDRGVIDSYIGPPALPADFGIYKITDYCIAPLFYYASNTLHIVNLDAWNRLPKNMQKLMDEVAEEIEPEWRKYIDDTNASQLQVSLDGGMELINLPPGVAEQYLDICNSVLWEEVKPLVSPETYDRLREALLK